MDFTEHTGNEFDQGIESTALDIDLKLTAEIVPLADAILAAPEYDLQRLRKNIRTKQKQIASAMMHMQHLIAEAKEVIRPTKLKAFLASECGMSRADIPTYFRFEETLGEHRDRVIEAGLPFSLLKALVAAPAAARTVALERMAAGSVMQATDITAIKKDIASKSLSPHDKNMKNRSKALASAARKRAKSALTSFGEDIAQPVSQIIDLYEAGQDGRLSQPEFVDQFASDMQNMGKEFLQRFEAVFDIASLPQSWEHSYHIHQDEQVSLARAHMALKSLAAGELQAWDEEYHKPYDTSHDFLDFEIVESLAWLAGGTQAVVRPQQKRKTLPAAPKAVEPPRRLKSLEICAGAGGQALGLHMAGFDAVGLWERNVHAAETLQTNYPLGRVHCEDVRAVDFRKYRDKVDLVAGGVPCQPHSTMGLQRGREDERDLFLEAVRIVDEVNPRAFFFENVEGFGHKGAADYRAELHELFAELGYESRLVSFHGGDYGLAQERPRVALIGFRDQLLHRFKKPPVLTETRVTVGEALLDIVASNGWPHAEYWAREKANKIGNTVLGGSENSNRTGFTANFHVETWARMQIDATSIAPMPPSATHGKDVPFRFTMEMGARLQGFPDGWQFMAVESKRKSNSKTVYELGERPVATKQRRMQIANALPPVMAHAMGLSIHSALTGVEYDYPAALARPYPTAKRNVVIPGKLDLASVRREQEMLEYLAENPDEDFHDDV